MPDCSDVNQAFAPERHVFNAFWHGRPLTTLHWACLASFIEAGHNVNLYTYHPLEVPGGIRLLDAREIIPCEEMFFFNNPELSTPDLGPFSDVFRFKLLLQEGGWWIDADVLCNSHDIPHSLYAWANEYPGSNIGTSQIRFPKGDPIVRELYEKSTALAFVMKYREEIGPRLMTRILKCHATPDDHFGTGQTFYPLRWVEGFKLWLPEFAREVQEKAELAYFISCWGSLASYIGIDLNRMPPRGSYLGNVIDRLAPGRIGGDAPYCAHEVLSLTRKWLNARKWALRELSAVTSRPLGRSLRSRIKGWVK